MRVTLVTAFDPNPATVAAHPNKAHVGGVERVFAEVSRQLAERGHDVTLICSTDGPEEVSKEAGIRVVRQKRRGTIMRAPVAPLARAIPPESDVVHVAATYPFTTPSVLKRSRDLGVPSVLDFHFEPDPGTRVGKLAAGFYRRHGTSSYRLADTVVLRSTSYGRSAPSIASIPEDRWRIIPNGIDPKRFCPNGNTGDGDYLLFVGRLVPYKGLHVLLRALAGSPSDLPLYIAGDGPLRQSLEAYARKHHLDVRFLGRVPDEQLPDLYRHARLTLLPSITGQEAFGITILESMACGTPAIASDLPGVADLAREGGLVAPRGDPEALAYQIHLACETGALPRGRALAERIHQSYSWDAVTDRLEAVYDEILENGPAMR